MSVEKSRGGHADLVYLLLVSQAAFGLVAMLGELLFMGNPLYALVPIAKAAFLFVLASQVVSDRRWALIATIVVEGLGLIGVWLSLLAGLLPQLSRTVTLVGLLTEIGLPTMVLYCCVRLLVNRPRPIARRPRQPVDPWPTAPITDELTGLPVGWPRPLTTRPLTTRPLITRPLATRPLTTGEGR